MNAITQHYIIDLSSNNNFVQVPAVQGDGNESRYVEIELIDRGSPYVIDPTECAVTIAGTKPDGKEIWNTCTITNEGYILVELTYQMTAVAGRGSYQIMIFAIGTNNQLKSFPFFVLVTPATYDPGYIISDDEFEALIQYTSAAVEAAEKAEEAEEKVEEAVEKVDEAVEKIDGAVAHVDEVYDEIVVLHTDTVSAKDAAETAASNASSSASAAATSASDAADSARAADRSALDAAEAASSADDSKTAAEEAAEYSSDRAEDSEAWAVGKRNGTDVGSTDPTYHNNSKFYSEQADTSATNAATSETNAASSASAAATSATNAATSETKAATSETNAATSETNASASALSAASSAATSQSWAVGGTGTRTGEDTNNAKYWSEQAQAIVGISDFTGATATTNGLRGLVPAPVAGQQNMFLKGDGSWAEASTDKIFPGTTQAWDALPATQKAEYKYVFFTND